MKCLYGLVVVCVLVLIAVPNAEASNCRQQQVVVQKVVQAEVVYPVVQQVVVPVYGLIPYYQPYSAPYVAQPQAVTTEQDVLKELISVIKDLRADVQALKAPARQEAPKLTDSEAKTIGLLRKNCAQCHNQASAELDGGGLTLFLQNGDFAGVKPDVAKRIIRRVGSGAMPPQPNKLDEADRKHILDAFKQ